MLRIDKIVFHGPCFEVLELIQDMVSESDNNINIGEIIIHDKLRFEKSSFDSDNIKSRWCTTLNDIEHKAMDRLDKYYNNEDLLKNRRNLMKLKNKCGDDGS